jgi:ribosome biogenesis GTPase / thiamine phosphate phosphatase
VRPGRGSRPRTRRRPAHTDAARGFVTAVDRGRYTCLVDGRAVTAMGARELGRKAVVVGDNVALAGDTSGDPGTLARIVRVEPRLSALRRSADDTDPVERFIVANASQMVIVSALASPPPRPRLIDRCLVAAYDAALQPLLCLTKSDLAAPEELLASYEPLGLPCVITRKPLTGAQLAPLRERLRDRISVLVGHSGVGKSTLINALVPEARRAISAVNPVTGRGRHTSSSAIALPLPDDGWIIDTPGVRSFGLAHVAADRVARAFPDLADGTAHCPPHCTHLTGDCTLDDWICQRSQSDPDLQARLRARLDSLRRLLASRDGEDPGMPQRRTEAVRGR